MMIFLRTQNGFTLIELVMVVIIISILAGIGTMKMISSIETSKYEATRAELRELSLAIAGKAVIDADGARTDFGYVGDVGALPPDLDALVFNPGFGTWDGPYIDGNFENDDFKKDAWNAAYIYAGTLLRSVGSGSNIDRVFAASTVSLLNNTVSGYILDADLNTPGTVYDDSVFVNLLFPDGSGGLTSMVINPDNNGGFSFSGIPVGIHLLQVIYTPDSDTMEYELNVLPGSGTYIDIVFPADLW